MSELIQKGSICNLLIHAERMLREREGEEEKEKWGVFRDEAGGQLRTNSVSVPNSPKRGGNQ